jgi:acyl-CoA synthetase (AMP-forming)/AMP-acid ligase II
MIVPPPSLRLEEIIRHHAETDAESTALLYAREPFAGVRVSFGELDRWADAFAWQLRAAGLPPGGRVAVILKDDPACIAAIYGVLRAGGVFIPVDPRWGITSIMSILRHADIDLLAAGGAAEVFDQMGVDRGYESRFLPFCPAPAGPVERLPSPGTVDDLAMIAFTSGTTSGPKGVMLRHRHLRAAYAACRRDLELTEPRAFGCILRLSGLGVLGTGYLLAHDCGAAAVVLPELTLETARGFWTEAARHRIDFIYLVPALVQIVNRLAEPPAPGSHLPLVMVGAAPITPEAMSTLQTRFGARMFNCYGLTEASFAVFFGQRTKEGFGTTSIGPARGVEARLLDPSGRTIEGPGTGLLQFRGPMLSEGYWRNPEATSALFDDGWLVTGDIAERDAEGNYFIRGRQKDVVIRGGFNIHLQEVDEALLNHPAVLGACSVGVPDRIAGEDVYALVKLKEDSSALREAELLEWCRKHLGEGRSPRRIVFSEDDIPRNGAGKVVRREALAKVVGHLRLRL